MSARIIEGDCLAVMPTLERESFDAIVCDPPYHLTTGKKGGSGMASVNLASPYGRARIGTGFMGKAWDGGDVAFRAETWALALECAKPGAHLVAFGGTRTFHRLTCAIEDAGWEIRDCLSWIYGSGFPKSLNVGDGRGTALKPAWEPIILARKPLIGTVAANLLQHGTAALNIDACRIATEEGANLGGGRISSTADGWDRPCKHDADAITATRERGDMAVRKAELLGRWPANVCLDEEAGALLDEQSGNVSGATSNGKLAGTGYDGGFRGMAQTPGYGDTGGASRFFYCAKASRSEREAGLDHLRDKSTLEDVGNKWTTVDYRDGHTRRVTVKNHHPTIKPIDLMQWLVRLITPKGGMVLDPFAGSGSTGIAALREGCSFVGIEHEAEYAEIARARITGDSPLFAGVA